MLSMAIDPGLRGCGVAWGHFDVKDKKYYIPGRLFGAGYVFGSGSAERAEAWHEMTEEICRLEVGPHLLIIEMPQVYQGSKQKGDPNDLINLQGVVASLSERFRFEYNTKVWVRLPREWKGQAPKEVFQARLLDPTIKSPMLLTKEEQNAIQLSPQKKLDHNIYDAVAMFKTKGILPAWMKL